MKKLLEAFQIYFLHFCATANKEAVFALLLTVLWNFYLQISLFGLLISQAL